VGILGVELQQRVAGALRLAGDDAKQLDRQPGGSGDRGTIRLMAEELARGGQTARKPSGPVAVLRAPARPRSNTPTPGRELPAQRTSMRPRLSFARTSILRMTRPALPRLPAWDGRGAIRVPAPRECLNNLALDRHSRAGGNPVPLISDA
jgi:hypothetical protein